MTEQPTASPNTGKSPGTTNRKKLIAIIAAVVLVLGGGGIAAALAIKTDNEYKAETAAICASALEERTLVTESVKETLDDTNELVARAESHIELESVETTSTLFAEKDATDTSKSGDEYVRSLVDTYNTVKTMTVLDECTSRDQAETITGQIDELKAAHAALVTDNTEIRDAIEQFIQEEIDHILAERKAEEERIAAERAEGERLAAEAARQRQAKANTPAPAPAPRSNGGGGTKTGGGGTSPSPGSGGGSSGGGGGGSSNSDDHPGLTGRAKENFDKCGNVISCEKHSGSHLPPGFNPAV